MMKANLLLCLGAIAIYSVIGSPTNDGRIVNGMEINIKQAPYMVRVLYGDVFSGGALVAPSYVVTAAHVVYNKTMSRFTIVANITTIYEEGIRRTVSRWAIHPDYNPTDMHTDIAVLQLNEPIVNIPKIKLCKHPLKEGDTIQVSGWGSVEANSSTGADTLSTVVLPVRSQQSCIEEFGNYVEQNMFCASGQREIGSCVGDSGGPAVYKGQLCGIVAFSYKCGEVGYQDVYTSIYPLKLFIQEFMVLNRLGLID